MGANNDRIPSSSQSQRWKEYKNKKKQKNHTDINFKRIK